MKNFLAIFGVISAISAVNLQAATYTVDTVTDSATLTACTAAPNDCSLRGAILTANGTTDADTIEFDAAVFAAPQTILMNGGDDFAIAPLATGGKLTINGPGANRLTLDGNNESRIFSLPVGSEAIVNGLTLTNGNGVSSSVNSGPGGAIYVTTSVFTLTNSVVTANRTSGTNSSGGIFVTGGATVSTITILNCTFSNNTAAVNAGGQINGNSTIVNSTFSGNTTTSTSVTNAGGLRHFGNTMLLVNSTITNNTAVHPTGGAGGFFRATAGTVIMRNTIIAGNNSPFSADVAGGVITSQGFNLIGVVTAASSGWVASDLLNQAANLGVLQNNGGTMPTHKPNAGSPAIDAGDDCVFNNSCAANNLGFNLTTDQIGQNRRADGGTALRVDIGAFEVQPQAQLVSVGGRVTSATGDGVPKAFVTVTRNSTGEVRLVRTNSFGFYRFDNILTGESYTFAVRGKEKTFSPQTVTVNGAITNLNFTAAP